MGTEEET